MRNLAILLTATAALTTLSACSGGDTQSASATVVSSGSTVSGTTTADPYAQFVNPTAARTYSGFGGEMTMFYNTDDRTPSGGITGLIGDDGQQGYRYAGNASTVRSSVISLNYDPRAATFTLSVKDPQTAAETQTRFQDPGSRTDFLGSRQPQWGTDNFAAYTGIGYNPNVRYLQAGDGDPLSLYLASGSGYVIYGDNNTPPRRGGSASATYRSVSFFYEVPGTTTKYVSLAGYVRNTFAFQDSSLSSGATVSQTLSVIERGAFAYGIQTDQAAVPKTGSGTYTGNMLATMVFNPTLDTATPYPNYFQWLSGTSVTTVNFATGGVTLKLDAIAGRPQFDLNTTPRLSTIAQGTAFTASGTATIDLVRTGGFTGQFQSASFASTTNGLSPTINIAGSSIDGTFFGPVAEEVGGGFRIVGGNPDQRIDIIGGFKGKKP
jgi:hypothetical protein